jgi:DNA-binding response OmpR family regulator
MPQRKTLLIIDDDADLRGAVAEQLQAEDFTALEASTARDGVRMAQDQRPDLILLDVDLPDMDGREACREMRAQGVVAPVIMLTAASADEDTVQGLDSGANDYVTKPYRFAVLLARIRAQLRSHEHSEGAVFRLGTYEFRPAAKMLLDEDGKKIHHPHAGNPRLSPAPEDRERPRQRPPAAHRSRRLSAGAVTRVSRAELGLRPLRVFRAFPGS